MNPLTISKPQKNASPDCADLMTVAEQELTAFFSAVTEMFGSEQAEHSACDWLRELEAVHHLPASTREWRLITIKVATRVANRVAPVLIN